MELTKKEIEEILENKFIDKIYDESQNFVMDLTGDDLSGVFDDPVDFAQLDSLDIELLLYNVEEVIGQKEVTGRIEIISFVEGYFYWEKENRYIGSEEMTFDMDFVFYVDNGKAEDVLVLQIYC